MLQITIRYTSGSNVTTYRRKNEMSINIIMKKDQDDRNLLVKQKKETKKKNQTKKRYYAVHVVKTPENRKKGQ